MDTSAWIEFFDGNEKGRRVKELILNRETFTASITIAELSYWYVKNNRNFEEPLEIISNTSQILQSNRLTEKIAGQLKFELNKTRKKREGTIGLVDCLIMSIAEENDLAIITTDKHFLNYSGKTVLL